MTKRNLILIGLVLLTGILAAAILLGRGEKNLTDLGSVVQLPTVLSSAMAPYGEDSIIFSNDRELATYNYVSGASAAVSPARIGQNLGRLDSLSVSDDQQYVLFHAALAEPGGLLNGRLSALRLDPQLDYWWIYSLASQQFTPLPGTISIARLSGDDVYALGGNAPSQQISVYSLADLLAKTTIDIVPASDFIAANGHIVLQTPDNKVLLTDDGVTSTQLASSARLVGFSGDRQSVFAVQTTKNSDSTKQKLVSLDFAEPGSARTIADGISGLPVLSPQGSVFYTTLNKSTTASQEQYDIFRYNPTADRTVRQRLTGSNKSGGTPQMPTSALDDSSLVTSSDGVNSFLYAQRLHSLHAATTEYQAFKDVGANSITVVYDDQTDGFMSHPRLSDLAAQQTAVTQQLQADGFNPDLYGIILTDAAD